MAFKKRFKVFRTDESGQVAVITAIVSLPLMLSVSLAVDANTADRYRTKLQSALDSAAIAAVSDQTLTLAERNAEAEKRFWENLSQDLHKDIGFDVVSSDDQRIELQGKMEIPTTFAGIIGKDSVMFNATSAAEIVKGSTVCMLALDPDSARSFEVTHGASVDANCTVQVNSLHETASVIDHGGKAEAKNFCIGGGAQGEYEPFVNTECATLSDPYTNIDFKRVFEPCVDQDELDKKINDWRATRDAVENHEIEENERWDAARAAGEVFYPTFFEKLHLSPGNYCNGLMLDANEFILDPGVYHITGGSFEAIEGTELNGEDVTFVMHGKANIHISHGSILNIKAPSDGPLAGLVFTQNLENKSIHNPTFPDVVSIIREGAFMNVLGTIYLPSHRIEFQGGSLSRIHAPATSFIAHQISIDDGADIIVSADHTTAGIPPIQPRSDDGARLVQ